MSEKYTATAAERRERIRWQSLAEAVTCRDLDDIHTGFDVLALAEKFVAFLEGTDP